MGPSVNTPRLPYNWLMFAQKSRTWYRRLSHVPTRDIAKLPRCQSFSVLLLTLRLRQRCSPCNTSPGKMRQVFIISVNSYRSSCRILHQKRSWEIEGQRLYTNTLSFLTWFNCRNQLFYLPHGALFWLLGP